MTGIPPAADYEIEPRPPRADSAQVLLTKSFWMPAASWFVSWGLAHWQPIVPVTDEAAAVLASLVAWAAIAVVRRLTARPAHFLKPKE